MKSILITGGGCEEAIDGVRSVTNFSSGETSSTLASIFADAGWSVTLLSGRRAVTPSETDQISVIRFRGYDDLERILKKTLLLKKYNAIIHAAAVSDFSISKIETNGKEYNGGEAEKISSDKGITVFMKPTAKLLPHVKKWGGNLFTVGFKLTNNAWTNKREKAVKKLIQEGGVDLIVSNDLTEIDQQNHLFNIFNASGQIVAKGKNKIELGETLLKQIEDLEGEQL